MPKPGMYALPGISLHFSERLLLFSQLLKVRCVRHPQKASTDPFQVSSRIKCYQKILPGRINLKVRVFAEELLDGAHGTIGISQAVACSEQVTHGVLNDKISPVLHEFRVRAEISQHMFVAMVAVMNHKTPGAASEFLHSIERFPG